MKRNSSLNHVFRLIWNQATRAWVAVAETSRGRGKSGRTQRSALASVVLAMPLAAAQAAPAGGQVTAGSGSVSHSGATTTVKQNSAALSLSWQSFNIGKSETVNFVQPTAKSIAVNRILDTNGSQILGRLNANGQVWLINPNGLLFGRGAQVNVGGLVASTLDVSDDSLSGSTHRFAGDSTAGVINQGHISASEGGSVVLLGHHVSNTGTISAQLGTVALAAGNATTLQFEGSRLVNLRVDDNLLDALADNGGLLQADGGQVLMSAGARNSVLASVVNNTGVIEARTVEQSEGRIVLLGGMAEGTTHVAGTLDASAPDGGHGGFIETSAAHVQVADGTRITTAAPRGQTGTWLIDPTDFTVDAGSAALTSSGIGADTLSTSLGSNNVTIETDNLNGNDAGDINVNSSVSWSANTLTLSAYNDININAALNGSGTASLAFEYGQGAVALNNTSRYNIHAPVSLPAGDNFSTTQGSDGTVQGWKVITDLGLAGSTTGIDLQGINLSGHYVLGADIDASATVNWNSGLGFAPIGSGATRYSGSFNGLGHSIGHLTINRTDTNYVGLFGATDTGSSISNVGLTDAAITGQLYVGALVGYNDGTITNSYATGSVNGSGSYVGGLVGSNEGTISNSYATGSVIGTKGVGALVGRNLGTISNSYATGSVSGADNVGGLVGRNLGTISNSYATGSVSGVDDAGGLVGRNYGSAGAITNSYATGAVSGNTDVGGLVGFNVGNVGTISNSYWDIDTSGQANGVSNVVNATSGAIGLSTTDALKEASYAGFDFTNTGSWYVVDGSTRPFLRMEYSTTISNAHQLQMMGMDLTAHYTLAGNIDLATELSNASGMWGGSSSGFAPIGTGSVSAFTGSFDGQGHTIDHLTINRSSVNNVGLFGYTDTTSVIRNVGLTDVAITGAASVGALVGDNVGTISNTYATGSVSGTTDVGGLVGANYAGSIISDSYATGSVSGTTSVGGLVGYNDGLGTITNTYATGSVSGTTYVGGLVGENAGTISGSHATGGSVNPRELILTLINSGNLPGFISGNDNVGGLVGFNATTGSITDSYAANIVSGSNYVGGLVGNNEGSISTSYAAGSGLSGPLLDYIASLDLTQTDTLTASVRGNITVGGLVGLNAATGTITDSYATGSVSGSKDQVGGLVGDNQGSIERTYASGSVSSANGEALIGGLVGTNSGTVSSSLWDIDTTGQKMGFGNDSVSGGATGVSTDDALEQTSYAGFDFTPVSGTWYMVEDSTRPFLQMEHSLTITNARQLQMMGMQLGASYTLANNIDLAAELADASGMWGGMDRTDSAGFAPIGTYATRFTGSFDGLGHTIGHLTINQPNDKYAGLFGYADTGSAISNVGLTDATLTGLGTVGALVGANLGTISNSYATGSVSGTSDVGALVGSNSGTLTDSYATGSVSGTTDVGGLVGFNDGTLTDSYATGSVSGTTDVGALVGANDGNVGNSYATGSVSGTTSVGGLVGYNGSSITNSYATGSVNGTTYVGGLVGRNYTNGYGTISNSYATGSVSGTTTVGGLVGYNNSGPVTDSYATGSVSGADSVGGLVGYNRSTITNTYATGSVGGSTQVGGLVGYNNSGTISNSLWDIDTTGQSVGIGGGTVTGATGLHTTELLDLANYTAANGHVAVDWDFTSVTGTWFMVNGSTRPFLRMEYSTTITNAHQLQMMAMDRTAHYTLANNIDLGPELANASGMWGGLARTDSAGFAPIGTFVDTTDFSTGFTGSFDGQGHTIAHLTIRRSTTDHVGLIGYASYGSSISNVGMTDVAVAGNESVGGLVGDNDGAISNSYATGSVSGTKYVGGLVGINYDGSISTSYATTSVLGVTSVGGLAGDNRSSITNSYATGSARGFQNVGGLVGENSMAGTKGVGTISNSYASGSVSGVLNVGGLVGDNSNSGTVSNSLWDIDTTGQLVGIGSGTLTGATGLSTANALKQASYTNFDFTDTGTWYMVDGSTRPFLRMEYSTTINNAHQLQLMGMDLGASYTLANNIDLAAELADKSGMWGGSEAGFAPIGGLGGLGSILPGFLAPADLTALTNGSAPDLSALGNWGTAAASVNAMSVLDGLGVFNGSFDGQGYSIGHLTISRLGTLSLDSIGVGLFGVAIGADIRNVSLTDANVTGLIGVGALVGINALGTISDSSVSGQVFGLAVVGGLAGVNALGTISDSSVNGTVGGLGVVGGLVGLQLAGTITGSHASGRFVGLIGVGGLVGGQALSLVQDSYASGSVEGALGGAGGLVGINLLSAVSTSYSDAEVSGTAFVGGLVGINLIGLVDNSYATGSVYGEDYVGGLVGGNPGLIRSSYASGSVSGEGGAGHVGGLTGGNLGQVIGSYWDIESSGQEFGIGTAAENQSGVTGLITADALTQAGYGFVGPKGFNGALAFDPGFDFDNTWYLVEGSTRPFLRMEHSTTISNAHQLQLMGLDTTAHYTLANDIDLGPELSNASGMWGANSAGFAPIGAEGDAFTGSFDGQGHTIDHLTINRSSNSFVGLFGYAGTGSAISNVGLNDADISGVSNVGALAGYSNGTISNSYATGSVAGTQYVGGLVGEVGLAGSVATSYSAADVSGTDHVGGLVGEDLGIISNSYATGSVSGDTNVGGLVGTGHKAIVNSYASGFVSGEGANVGGLAGSIDGGGYVIGSFWDVDSTGQAFGVGSNPTASGVIGLATTDAALLQDSYDGFDFNNTWYMVEGSTRPFLRMEHSTTISNAHQLQLMSLDLSADYTLANELDLGAELNNASSMWGGMARANSAGFVPIGDSTTAFTGSFDGQGYSIDQLTINRATTNGVGLFGYVGEGSEIRSVGLSGVVITGGSFVGALVGKNSGTMSRNAATGIVSGVDKVGGLIGQNSGTVTNGYATGSVSGDDLVGGLIGKNSGAISDSYASGSVSGDNKVGGLVGRNSGTISDSGAAGNVNGDTKVGGLVGSNVGGAINDSYAAGNVSGNDKVGGLVGYSRVDDVGPTVVSVCSISANCGSPPPITNSYATGAVSGKTDVGGLVGDNIGAITNSYATGSVNGSGNYVGGLVGSSEGGISNSYATGSVIGTKGVGALVGQNSGDISNSYATGSVSGADNVGGLVGRNLGTISNSYATGSVSGVDDAGGLVGRNLSGTITNSYATGAVSGNTDVGGLVGRNLSGTITSSYWNITSTGQTSSAGGVGLTQAQMTSAASYDGWDFDNTWVIYEGHTAPLLRSFMTALTVTVDYGEGATKVYDATTVYNGGTVVSYSLDDADTARIYGDVTGTLSSSHVGSRTVTADGGLYSDQQGYIISYDTSANNTVEVTPATLTYRANAASFFNGQTPTGLSGTIEGWMGDDTLASATCGCISWTTSALSSSYPGYYDITGGGLTASDYVFVQAAGNATALTLNPARLPDDVSAVTTQMTSTLPIIRDENGIGLTSPRRDPGWRAVGLGVRLPDDAVSSEVTP